MCKRSAGCKIWQIRLKYFNNFIKRFIKCCMRWKCCSQFSFLNSAFLFVSSHILTSIWSNAIYTKFSTEAKIHTNILQIRMNSCWQWMAKIVVSLNLWPRKMIVRWSTYHHIVIMSIAYDCNRRRWWWWWWSLKFASQISMWQAKSCDCVSICCCCRCFSAASKANIRTRFIGRYIGNAISVRAIKSKSINFYQFNKSTEGRDARSLAPFVAEYKWFDLFGNRYDANNDAIVLLMFAATVTGTVTAFGSDSVHISYVSIRLILRHCCLVTVTWLHQNWLTFICKWVKLK